MKKYLLIAMIVITVIIAIVLGALFMMKSVDNSQTESVPTSTPVKDFSIEDQEKLDLILERIDNSTPYDKLITYIIDINDFIEEYYTKSFDFHSNYNSSNLPLITKFNDKFEIECLRTTDTGEMYSVHKVKQGGLLYVFYIIKTDSPQRGRYVEIKGWYYAEKNLKFEDFSSIENGASIDKVVEIDPATEVFIEIARHLNIDDKMKSTHYTEDGLVHISYAAKAGSFEVSGRTYKKGNFRIDIRVFPKDDQYRGQILPMDIITTE